MIALRVVLVANYIIQRTKHLPLDAMNTRQTTGAYVFLGPERYNKPRGDTNVKKQHPAHAIDGKRDFAI